MECFKLEENEIYNLSELTKEERNIVREYLYNITDGGKEWGDGCYINLSNVLYYEVNMGGWTMNHNNRLLSSKNAKDLFCTTEQATIKKHSYSWEDREELRNKWFKRKNSQEESIVRHIQNKKNMTTGEFELHINGINIEQFEKEFEWIG